MQLYSKSCTVKITADQPLADIIFQALGPELQRSISRSETQIDLYNIDENQSVIELKINAADLTALRAALNSYLRWLNIVVELYEFIQAGDNSKSGGN